MDRSEDPHEEVSPHTPEVLPRSRTLRTGWWTTWALDLALLVGVVLALSWPLPLHIVSYNNNLISSASGTSDLYSVMLMHQRIRLGGQSIVDHLQTTSMPVEAHLHYALAAISELALRTRSWNVLDVLCFFWPLRELFGLLGGWNAAFLAFFILNALAGYQLGRWVGGGRAGGWVGALVLAANPMTLIYTWEGRPIQLVLFLFPPVIWATRRILTRDNTTITMLLGAVALTLLAQFYWFYGLFVGVIMAAMVALPLRRIPWRRLGRLTAMGLLAILLALPMFGATGDALEGTRNTQLPRADVHDDVFPRPASPELSQDQHIVLMDSLPMDAPLYSSLGYPSPRTENIGQVYWGLALLAAGAFRRWRQAMPWVAVGGVAWMLSWGPWLEIGQASHPLRIGGHIVPNPLYHFLYDHVSPFRQFLHPYRFMILSYIALAALAALGARHWPTLLAGIKTRLPLRKIPMVAIGITLTLAQMAHVGLWPLKMANFVEPEGLDKLGRLTGMVLHLPMDKAPGSTPPAAPQYERRQRLLQIYHSRPLPFYRMSPPLESLYREPAMLPRLSVNLLPLVGQAPLFFGQPEAGLPSEEILTALRRDNIRWVLLDEGGTAEIAGVDRSPALYNTMRASLERWLGPARREYVINNKEFMTWTPSNGQRMPDTLRLAVFVVP